MNNFAEPFGPVYASNTTFSTIIISSPIPTLEFLDTTIGDSSWEIFAESSNLNFQHITGAATATVNIVFYGTGAIGLTSLVNQELTLSTAQTDYTYGNNYKISIESTADPYTNWNYIIDQNTKFFNDFTNNPLYTTIDIKSNVFNFGPATSNLLNYSASGPPYLTLSGLVSRCNSPADFSSATPLTTIYAFTDEFPSGGWVTAAGASYYTLAANGRCLFKDTYFSGTANFSNIAIFSNDTTFVGSASMPVLRINNSICFPSSNKCILGNTGNRLYIGFSSGTSGVTGFKFYNTAYDPSAAVGIIEYSVGNSLNFFSTGGISFLSIPSFTSSLETDIFSINLTTPYLYTHGGFYGNIIFFAKSSYACTAGGVSMASGDTYSTASGGIDATGADLKLYGGDPNGSGGSVRLSGGSGAGSAGQIYLAPGQCLGTFGNVVVSGHLSIEGRIFAYMDTYISGNLTVTGNTDILGTLTVSGNTTVSGNLAVTGNITASGDVTAANAVFTGTLDVNGVATVSGGLTVSGNLNVTGSISSTVTSTIYADLVVSGNLSVTGNANISGDVSANNLNLSGALDVVGNALVSGSLTVSGNITATGSIEVYATSTVHADLNVSGNFAVSGNSGFGTTPTLTGVVTISQANLRGMDVNGTRTVGTSIGGSIDAPGDCMFNVNAGFQTSSTSSAILSLAGIAGNNNWFNGDFGRTINNIGTQFQSRIVNFGGTWTVGATHNLIGAVLGTQPFNYVGAISSNINQIAGWFYHTPGAVPTGNVRQYGWISNHDNMIISDKKLYLEGNYTNAGLLTSGENYLIFNSTASAIQIFSSSSQIAQFKSNAAQFGRTSSNSTFDASGVMTLTGAAQVWDDLRVPGLLMGLATTAPSMGAFGPGGNLETLMFPAAVMRQTFFELQLPHHWKEQSAVYPHIHWCPNVTGTAAMTIVWGLEYSWASINGTFASSTTIYVTASAAFGAWSHKKSEFPAINATGQTISSMLSCRLFRYGLDAADTYTSTASLLEFDLHYQRDALGSRTENTK